MLVVEAMSVLVRNKKGVGGDLIRSYILYLVLFLALFTWAFYLIGSYQNNAAFWEKVYSSEISRAIDLANSGDEIKIDISEALKVADKSRLIPEEIFFFDNSEGKVSVRLKNGKGTSFSYFNNLSVENYSVSVITEQLFLEVR